MDMTETAQIPAGWYPDGTDPRLRWWDGTQWTEVFAPESQGPKMIKTWTGREITRGQRIRGNISMFFFGMVLLVVIIILVVSAAHR